MSERRKKVPKVAWRDLLKGGAEPSPTSKPDASSSSDAPTSPSTPRADDIREAVEKPATPPRPKRTRAKATPDDRTGVDVTSVQEVVVSQTASEPAPAMSAPIASPPIASPPVASAPVASAPVASAPVASAPVASAVGPAMDEARKHEALSVTHEAPRGAPPKSNMPPKDQRTVTTSARAEAPPRVPASTPEAEVHRILTLLASNQPAPRRAPVVEVVDAFAEFDALVPRGPMLPEEDAAPLVSPAELREASRMRRGRVDLLLFRVGGELFALPLGAVEEAIETPAIHPLPEMPAAMLGVFNLRERLVPTYSPGSSLGVALAEPAGAALLVRAGERRIALAADDVEDVMELDLSTLRDAPVVEDTDGILLGVARFDRELVGVLDAEALIVACIGGRTVEIS